MTRRLGRSGWKSSGSRWNGRERQIEFVVVPLHLQHHCSNPGRPPDAAWRRAGRAIGLPEEVPGERRIPHDPRLVVDGDSVWFDPRIGISRADVSIAAGSGDLQIALVVGVCDTPVAERTNQQSTFRDCVGIPCDRAKLPVGYSVGAAFRNSMNAKTEADCEEGTTRY